MKVKIKRLDKNSPLPIYATPGSVAFDIAASETTEIAPHEVGLIPTGLIISVPVGCALMLVARSSMPRRYGLLIPNGVGIIDQDYCGPGDEFKIQVYNFIDKMVCVKKGERLAQGIFVKIEKADWEEIEEINNKNRGGFGSTG